MDRNFARSLALVLKSEGGWSDKRADPGGATMKGVTLANFRRYVKADASKADLKKITDEQVDAIYRRFYWDAVLGAELPDGVDYAVFDFAVNSGPGRAAKYLQAVLGVAEDGRVGPATVAAARAKPAGVVIDTLCDARLAFLQRLPTWPTFGKGWNARVASVRAQALLISAQPEAPTRPPQTPTSAAGQPAVSDSGGDGTQPAISPAPGTSAKTAGILALIALAFGSAAAWAAHLPCNLLGVFCQ
ncbi:glycosyl hydrolase 108 family protein [Mesorhizobium sp. VK23B]|uniref:Glycosyl hydrolase 108 family protein n=1 Tax=Mesorhizobium dulcispinae TaxID=3072316 RepID=A0ABU4XMT4_9HYPH|nr:MULTISPECIES: glycosyl hydrolase 108 family protein [unclassified Mesorhizobium]MDX8468928.1 glycosyl hydrolase 108 family protein [Mesorhizobium sp. VK23B]MDX8475283.1 glycosyl hydrolase 108 family protein [Mesorhizobium sp. VK23A]MDX8520885.1 glycosyl hydrolase 108 family protein [Mesorhizobium sp. VK23D]